MGCWIRYDFFSRRQLLISPDIIAFSVRLLPIDLSGTVIIRNRHLAILILRNFNMSIYVLGKKRHTIIPANIVNPAPYTHLTQQQSSPLRRSRLHRKLKYKRILMLVSSGSDRLTDQLIPGTITEPQGLPV